MFLYLYIINLVPRAIVKIRHPFRAKRCGRDEVGMLFLFCFLGFAIYILFSSLHKEQTG